MTEAMRREAERRGATFFFQHRLVDFKDKEATFETGEEAEKVTVRAEHIVLALPSVALAKLKPLRSWRTLRHLHMTPLLRFYGVFPKDADGGMWYDEFGGRVITAGHVRYMIPGYAPPEGRVGSAQISYTDTQDAEYWIERIAARGERAAGMEVIDELREWLKPTIPTPLFLRAHVWPAGVTYWLPGKYSAEEESRAAVHPMPERFPGLWICGESFSLRQAWMEGALEHAELMLRRLKRVLASKKKHAR
jgi:glycine/D-amino acid oxidase-like deaminating enzyme